MAESIDRSVERLGWDGALGFLRVGMIHPPDLAQPSPTAPHTHTHSHGPTEVDKESPPVPVLFNAEVALLLNKQKKNYQEKGIRVPECVHACVVALCILSACLPADRPVPSRNEGPTVEPHKCARPRSIHQPT